MKPFAFKSYIYRRLILFFMLVGIVPTVLLSFASYRITQNSIHEKARQYSNQLMMELCDYIERVLLPLENIAIDISYTEAVQNYFRNYSSMTDAQRRNRRNEIRMSIAVKTSLIRELTDVYVYLPNGEREILYGIDGYKFSLQDIYENEYLQLIYDSGGKTVIRSYSGNHQMDNIRRQQDTEKGIERCILIGRLVRELESGDVLGVITLRINEQIISKRLKKIDLGRNAEIIVLDANGRIVSSTNQTAFPVAEALRNDLTVIPSQFYTSEPGSVNYNDSYMILRNNIDSLGWSVICLIPYDYLDYEAYMNFRNMLLLLCCICIAMIIGIGLFSSRISNPLTELVEAMNLVKEGNLNVEIHFLSNTLNTVRCLAHTQKAYNIENILVSLIELLHVSMDIREDFIPISREISYVRSYLEIMSYRDYGSFNVVCEVEPELEDSLVPKLILQPLVENALIHGLKNKNVGGQIIIRVTGNESNIYISVTDNGQGIPPEILPNIMKPRNPDDTVTYSGIGLSNVDGRIKMLFGNDYGIYVDSIYKMYTTVEVVLPN